MTSRLPIPTTEFLPPAYRFFNSPFWFLVIDVFKIVVLYIGSHAPPQLEKYRRRSLQEKMAASALDTAVNGSLRRSSCWRDFNFIFMVFHGQR